MVQALREKSVEVTKAPELGKGVKVALLTGGKDPDYSLGLTGALASQGIEVELVADDHIANGQAARHAEVTVRNLLRGEAVGFARKALRVIRYYSRLIGWAGRTEARILHILWYGKLPYFERHLLNAYFKALGRQLVYTAHNVDDRRRDNESSWLNRLSLRFMYRSVDHILVHTPKMKHQLGEQFAVPASKITVVPHGINDRMPESGLDCAQARRRLGFGPHEKILLFFGNIAPYKGVDLLAGAFVRLVARDDSYRLVVAGRIKKPAYREHWRSIEEILAESGCRERARLDIRFIPDEDVEVYFKGSDVSILPYRHIFQSGVMILSYRFGLPVVAADVGSLRQDILPGETGFLCRPDDPQDLAQTIERYFHSDLCRQLAFRRSKIQQFVQDRFSWERNVCGTLPVYRSLLTQRRREDFTQRRKDAKNAK